MKGYKDESVFYLWLLACQSVILVLYHYCGSISLLLFYKSNIVLFTYHFMLLMIMKVMDNRKKMDIMYLEISNVF